MNKLLVVSICTFTLLVSLAACAMGSKRPPIERKDEDKLWRACQDFEIQDGSPVGKLCNRTCINRKGGKCTQWKQRSRNFCEQSDFEFYRASSFIFIDEDNL